MSRGRQVAWGTALCVAILVGACGQSAEPSTQGATTTGPAAPEGSAHSERLVDLGHQLLADTGATGGIVALREGDAAPIVAAVGHEAPTGADPGPPFERDAPLHVASVTKSYVAALALAFEADGTVGFDAPIARWITWPGGDRITLRHLLTHTSGVGRFGDGESPSPFLDLIARGEPVSTSEALDAARTITPLGDPGGSTRYSNLNYLLAGAVLESAAGAPLHHLLRTRIFEPLGLDHTWYPPEQPAGDGPPIGLFEVEPGLPPVTTDDLRLDAWQTATGGASGATATVDDLLTWSDAVFRAQAVGGVELHDMTDIGAGGYGLGVIGLGAEGDCVFDGCPPGTVFERWALNGDFPGASTRVVHDPTSDTTLIVHLNRNALDLDAAVDAFLDRL